MASKSVQDVAESVLKKKKKPIEFKSLWENVSEDLQLNEIQRKSKMVKFYNALSLDSRFIQLDKNKWDLRERHTYTSTRIKIESFDVEDDDTLEVEEINEIAKLPGREGMYSMLLGMLQAPVSKFARVVKAVADAREENGGEAPVEAPAEEKVEEAAE